ncbi:MAG: flippase [Candidatus Paceibacter sp.]|nr:flippase [Candidatus Paceibacter sp.]
MTSEIYKKIGTNSIYNLIRRFVTLPIGLILPPITIKYIGVEGYGIWVLIQTLITYTSLMDMGLSPAITKYTAEYEAREDHFKILQIFNTLFVVYVVLCFILFVIVFSCGGLIIDLFIKSTKISKETVFFVLITSSLVFCCNMVFSVYSSFLNGMQRMDITNKIGSISSISNFIFSIVFLYLGGGIKSLAVASGISCIITSTMYIHASKKIAPYLVFNPFLFSFKTIKEIWGFSSYGAMGNLVAMIHFQSDKLIISYFLGVNSLAFYDIAHRLVFFIWGLCGSLITPIMPAISHTHAKYGSEGSKEVFQTIFKYTTLIACPLFLFVSVFADKLILVWLGTGYGNAISVLRVLSLAYFLNILSGPGASILTGMGFYKIPFHGGVITAITTILLCPILIIKFGILGSAIGIMSAYGIGVFYLFIQLQKVFDTFSIPRILYNSLVFPVVTSMSIFLATSTLIKYFVINKYFELIPACISLLIAYCLITFKDRRYRAIWESISAIRL